MQVDKKETPRKFAVGENSDIVISHVADVTLNLNEQVTFHTSDGSEYDFVKKDWGFYATPSINRRLKSFGFRTALVQNKNGHVYIFVVEQGKDEQFDSYCKTENQTILMWLDRINCDDVRN